MTKPKQKQPPPTPAQLARRLARCEAQRSEAARREHQMATELGRLSLRVEQLESDNRELRRDNIDTRKSLQAYQQR